MNKHYLLRDVARLLKVKPYQIAYALSVGLVPEPELEDSPTRGSSRRRTWIALPSISGSILPREGGSPMTYDEISDKYFARADRGRSGTNPEPGRGSRGLGRGRLVGGDDRRAAQRAVVAVPRRPRAGIGRGNGHE